MYKIKIDEKKCIGCGTCSAICPSVFEIDQTTAKAKIKVAKSDKECVREAVESCPEKAISIINFLK